MRRESHQPWQQIGAGGTCSLKVLASPLLRLRLCLAFAETAVLKSMVGKRRKEGVFLIPLPRNILKDAPAALFLLCAFAHKLPFYIPQLLPCPLTYCGNAVMAELF